MNPEKGLFAFKPPSSVIIEYKFYYSYVFEV